jgi:hypothetical protein
MRGLAVELLSLRTRQMSQSSSTCFLVHSSSCAPLAIYVCLLSLGLRLRTGVGWDVLRVAK